MSHSSNGELSFAYSIVAFFVILFVAFSALSIFGLWKTLEKAGQHGWIALIPGYNLYALLQISGLPVLLLIFYFFGPLAIIPYFLISISLPQKFNYSTTFGFLIFFAPTLAFLILGLSDHEYAPNLSLPLHV